MSRDTVTVMVTNAVENRVKAMEERLIGQFTSTTEQIRAILTQHVSDAFPSGSLHKHREYHEERIKASDAADRIKADLVSWSIKGIVGLLIVLVGLGAMEWFKRELIK